MGMNALERSILEEKEALKKAQEEQESQEDEVDGLEEEQEEEQEIQEETELETEPEQETQEEPKQEAEEDANLAARLRIAEKERKRLEKQIEEFRQSQQPQPQKQDDNNQEYEEELTLEEEVKQLKQMVAQEQQRRQAEQNRQQAVKQFIEIENEYKREVPDYEDVSNLVVNSMYKGVKSFNPEISDSQAKEYVQNQVLTLASNAYKQGKNPAEYLYELGLKNYGYQPKAEKSTENSGASATERLKNAAKNKKRSANGLAGGGQAKGKQLTVDSVANMSNAEFSQLSSKELKQLMAGKG
jgi:hypothetical protein